jgi:hypothetical protein
MGQLVGVQDARGGGARRYKKGLMAAAKDAPVNVQKTRSQRGLAVVDG